MPLSINVGLTRKASKDYQSTGVSINIQAELDSSLLAHPDELQKQIASVYAQAEAALARQVEGAAPAAQPAPRAQPVAMPSRGGYTSAKPSGSRWSGRSGVVATAGKVGGNTPPAATESQIKAIHAIAKSIGLDANAEAETMGFKLNVLSRGDASRMIEQLKSYQQPRVAA